MTNLEKCFGANIKKFRKAKKLSQEKLAEMLDIAPTTMSNLETGKTFVSWAMLMKLANLLEVEPYELFLFKKLQAKDVIYKKILENLKSEKVKNNPKILALIYEITELEINKK